MLALLGVRVHSRRSGLSELEIFILIPAVRNTESAKFADNAGTCSLQDESAYRSALVEWALVSGHTTRERGAIEDRLVSLLDRDGPPEEPPARLELELERRRSRFPILVAPCFSIC